MNPVAPDPGACPAGFVGSNKPRVRQARIHPCLLVAEIQFVVAGHELVEALGGKMPVPPIWAFRKAMTSPGFT
jgi:hypothetical protein